MIKVVIFDLDDTLYEEKEFAFSAFQEISVFLKGILKDAPGAIYKNIETLYENSPNKIFDRLFEQYKIQLDSIILGNLVNKYRNHMPKIQLSEKVKKILISLRSEGYKIAIITDGYKESQRNKISALKLNDYVDQIVITDEFGRQFWKPSKYPFQVVKNNFNFEFQQMVYIGDNINKDFLAPNLLGMKSIHLNRSDGIYFSKNEFSDDYKASIIIDDLNDVYNIVKGGL